MSMAFEVIVLTAPFEEVWVAFCNISSPLTFDVRENKAGWSMIYRMYLGKFEGVSDEVDRVGEDLSRKLGKTLVVRYYSTTCYHSASMYEHGKRLSSFGEDDEIWVPLDEEGRHILDAGMFKLSELDDEVEYDTLRTAIDLGLQAMGVNSTLRDLYAAVYEAYNPGI